MQTPHNIPIRYLKGIGPKKAQAFAVKGVNNIEDLLYYLPVRYEDRTAFTSIVSLKQGSFNTIKVTVLVSGLRRSFRRRGFSITQAMVEDDTGRLTCVWFNQPYLKNYLKPQTKLILYGRLECYNGKLQMSNPEFELIDEDSQESYNIGRIVPIYSLISGIGQRSFRKLMHQALDKYVADINDFLPFDIRQRHGLLNLAKSLVNIHFPADVSLQQQAYKRLAFEEFFLFQIPLVLRKLHKKQNPGITHVLARGLADEYVSKLPFKLTASQMSVLAQIKEDLSRPQAMQRLLQGDVGSGKTVVATIACLVCVQGGYQAAFMVPTEILAKQHYEKIKSQILKLKTKKVNVALLTSGLTAQEKQKTIQGISEGSIDIIIGTHALLEEGVVFKSLGFVVIDEQHRFGVGQRALLPQKGNNPDVLIMTATPIPRTLAITVYGDLDVSMITELPPGRKPVTTQWIDNTKRQWLYEFIRKQVRSGRQAYIVYPVIEESYNMDLLSAQSMYQEFADSVFKEFSIGLLHARIKQSQQDKIMGDFKAGKIQILVATTVLEVGIDVANASVMVIEHADRFGLSQLHQLRGRIGRGEFASFCILVSQADTPEAQARLNAMVATNDGFSIAEEDLRIRGPGEYFGSRQHGLTGLRIGNPLTQMQLLKNAREEAITLVSHDPNLRSHQNVMLKEKLLQRFPEYENYNRSI